MKRRTYLAGFGVATASLSGCIEGAQRALTGRSFQKRTVSIVSVNQTGEYDVTVDAEVTEPESTARHPAKLRLAWTNNGASASPYLGIECVEHPDPLWSIYAGFELSNELVLIPSHQRPSDSGAIDCWTPPEGSLYSCSGAGGVGASIEPRSSISHDFTLWNHPRARTCMPPGEYRFGHEVSGGPGIEDETPFAWMFTLAIDKPR